MSTVNLDKKANYLAMCLLESLEDEDLRAAKLFLEKYKCNPNTIIYERGIAPIHYVSGMENLEIAEAILGVMMKNGGNPNVRSHDGMTPLHVACLTGHCNIVKLLLQHGGDIHLYDSEKKTPVQYAVYEYHLDVVKTIQNFVFEQKVESKKREISIYEKSSNCQSPRNKNLLSIQQLEDNKYTPNRVHYNFDVTSPYYIYITHRKSKNSDKIQPVDLNEMPSPPPSVTNEQENLFKLTEENLDRFSDKHSAERSRMSLIQVWREKVANSRQRSSVIRVFRNIEEFFECSMTEESLNFTNTLIDANAERKCKTTPAKKTFANFLDNLVIHEMDSELSFETAVDNLNEHSEEPQTESNFIKSPQAGQYVMQVAETYTITDDENGLVFYETRLHSNPGGSKPDAKPRRGSETSNFTLPPDYDTDALRAELTTFGEVPGPITKSTKRLYLKRLIKYQRSINTTVKNNETIEQKFSVELERTVSRKDYFDRIQDYMPLEKELSQHFQFNEQKRKFREGNLKKSFIYLLIDPRVSKNLPGEFKYMTQHEVWSQFLNSIFYVGKGKSSRPYSHLYDAMKIFSRNREHLNRVENLDDDHILFVESGKSRTPIVESQKLNRILDIWQAKRGVVCLHVFHNLMPAEAYTREAAIIDAISLKHLTNMKRGDYYGPCQAWPMRNKKFLGIALLFKSMQIFLAEGESQLTPSDLI